MTFKQNILLLNQNLEIMENLNIMILVENHKIYQFEDTLNLFEITVLKIEQGDFWSKVFVSEQDEEQAIRLLNNLN